MDVTIVGGGITGLTAAYLASQAGHRVRVIEGSGSFGGLLGTFPVGETRLEAYYHHFFTHDAEITWLLQDLGLSGRQVFYPTTMGVFREGRIWDFNGPLDLLKFGALDLPSKLRFAASSLYLGKFKDWRRCEGISASQWLRKVAGRRAYDAVWGPLLDIKFGPHAPEVPLAWMVGRLRQRMSSRKGASDERLGYLSGSLDILLQALLEVLKGGGAELILDAPIENLRVKAGRLHEVETAKGVFRSDVFLFTIPAIHMVPLLRGISEAYAGRMAQVNYFGAVCVILELDRQFSPVYWLNVADPGFSFGGIIEQTNLIPPEVYGGRHILYLSRYFAYSDSIAEMAESAIAEGMTAELKRIRADFRKEWIRKTHVFRTRTAATVCDLNFSAKVPPVRSPIEGLFYAGMPHVYPDERSVNNSIRVAAEACRVMGLDIAKVPVGQSLSAQIGFNSQAQAEE